MKALWQKLMKSRGGFFRESGWLLVATVVSGLFMYAVHLLARKIGPAEYGVFLWFVGLSIFIPAMTQFHAEPVQLLQVMVVSNSILLIVSGGFYWVSRKHFQLSRSSESA